MFWVTAPAHPHATDAAVYTALFLCAFPHLFRRILPFSQILFSWLLPFLPFQFQKTKSSFKTLIEKWCCKVFKYGIASCKYSLIVWTIWIKACHPSFKQTCHWVAHMQQHEAHAAACCNIHFLFLLCTGSNMVLDIITVYLKKLQAILN